MGAFILFLKKNGEKFCRFGKLYYLCTRNRERCSSEEEDYCGNSSVGRAQPCQGWGRGSESRFPLHMLKKERRQDYWVGVD